MNSSRKNNDNQKPIPVIDADVSQPIDVKKAIEQLGGNPFVFYSMLEKFEDMSLITCMNSIAQDVEKCMEKQDAPDEDKKEEFKQFRDDAHSLKGASGYICASHLHYACYFIQEHFQDERFKQMMEYYPTLLEAAVEFRVYSRQVLAKHKSKQIS